LLRCLAYRNRMAFSWIFNGFLAKYPAAIDDKCTLCFVVGNPEGSTFTDN